MKNIMRILVVAALFSLSVATISFAADRHMDKCCMGRGMGMMKECPFAKAKDKAGFEEKFYAKAHFFLSNAKEIGLTADQKEKIKDLKLKIKKSLTLKDAEIEVAALDIKDALGEEGIDINALNSLIDKKYESKKARTKEVAAAYVELKGLLSKEQVQKVKDLWEDKTQDKKKMGKEDKS